MLQYYSYLKTYYFTEAKITPTTWIASCLSRKSCQAISRLEGYLAPDARFELNICDPVRCSAGCVMKTKLMLVKNQGVPYFRID